MEDDRIVRLFWDRAETAIDETDRKYRRYLLRIARNILGNDRDAEECVNDTYLRAWNAIPPHEPRQLSTFLGKITRRLALDRYDALTAQKRGGGTVPVLLEEWRDCLPATGGDAVADELTLRDALNRFLRTLPTGRRRMFLRRYWYADSIRDIARDAGCGESKVKMALLRTRRELKEFLEKENITV